MKMKTSIFKRLFWLVMNERGSVGALGETPPVDDGTPPVDDETPPIDDGAPTPEQALYGEIKVQWPEGFADELKGEASLKSFVNEKGEINIPNLAKSFIHTKKQMGKDKAVLPNENSPEEEVNQFWEKLGYKANKEEYIIDNIEESKLEEKFVTDLKEFAHANRIPLETANKLAGFLNGQAVEGDKQSIESRADEIEAGLNTVKEEFGKAYGQKLALAQRVLNDTIKDPAVLDAFKDPEVGSNPAVIKALVAIGESLYREDGFGGGDTGNLLSPSEAEEKINSIRGDKNHPYNLPKHPGHDGAVKKMMKLFEMKN